MDRPAAESAYAFVQPSYQLLLTRHATADARLQQLGTVIPTITFGIVAFVAAAADEASPDFTSAWMIIGIGVASMALAISWFARFKWVELMLPNPAIIHAEHLDRSPEEFQAKMIEFAGRHFEKNANTIYRMYQASVAAAVLYAVALVALTVWATRQL